MINSKETRNKISKNHIGFTGKHHSEESKLKSSKSHSGENNFFYSKIHSKETRKIMSDFKIGIKLPEETKRKMSESGKGKIISKEQRKKISKANWKGGLRIANRRNRHKRRKYLTTNPIELNKEFNGSEGHHIDETYIINIPYNLHRSIYHNQFKNINMIKINKFAFKYLYEHKNNMLISIEEAFKINLICINKWSNKK